MSHYILNSRTTHILSLCCSGGATSNLIVNPMILTAKCIAVCQQTVITVPKVDISGLREPLCGVRWCRHRRTDAPEFPLWRIWDANPAVVCVFRVLFTGPAYVLSTAQFRVAKSPNHPAEIEEKRAHDHDHERVGLYHGFGDWRSHLREVED